MPPVSSRFRVGMRPSVVAAVTVLALLAGLLAGLTGVPSSRAAECPGAGGDDRPFAADEDFDGSSDDVVLTGGGWGHGVGMSQYGAKGGALLGCTYEDIVTTYYEGTTVGSRDMPSTIRVGLTDLGAQSGGGITVSVLAEGESIDWNVSGCETDGACRVQPPVQPAGATWSIRSIRGSAEEEPEPDSTPTGSPSPGASPSPTSSPSPSPSPSPTPTEPAGNAPADGAYVIRDGSGEEIWRGGDLHALLTEQHGQAIKVNVAGLVRRFRWGYLELDSYAEGNGKLFVVQNVTSGDGATGMERYLWGLAEVPASWPLESLKAQALAARSYAIKRVGLTSRAEACRCDIYATVRDQHYQGWDYEESDRANGGRWKQAVDATAGEVIEHGGEVVDAFYSSSHGGSSEASKHVWGGDVPYLQAVDTSRWENAEGVNNSRQRWDVGFSNEELASRFGLQTVTSFEIASRGPGGRPTRVDDDGDGQPDGVRVDGTDANGDPVTRWFSGEQLRSRLSLYSSLVHVSGAQPQQSPSPSPSRQPDTTRSCPPGEVPDAEFRDVSDSSVHKPAIDCVVWWEVAHGVDESHYEPLADVPRDQMASFIARAVSAAGVDLPEDPGDHFADDDGSAHEGAINRLAEVGLVRGTGEDDTGDARYSPALPVTRDQMASFLVRAYELAAERTLDEGRDAFDDDDGNVHEESINKARAALIASGTGERTYAPRQPVSRGQMASFLARVLNGLVEEEKASPPSSGER